MKSITHNGITIKKLEEQTTFCSSNFYNLYRTFIDSFKDKTFEEFKTILRNCSSCTCRPEANQVVTPEGSELVETIIVGRNPGQMENAYGRVFHPDAPAGRILNSFYLGALNIPREFCYITQSSFCHTYRDREPTQIETSLCSVWKYIEFSYLKNARYIFLLGLDAIQQFLGYETKFDDVFKTIFQTKLFEKDVMLIPVYHPGYLCRRHFLLPELTQYLYTIGGVIKLDKENKLIWL
jgi:uracil-DNA glycosylase family 4